MTPGDLARVKRMIMNARPSKGDSK
jgi:hypothetical protein